MKSFPALLDRIAEQNRESWGEGFPSICFRSGRPVSRRAMRSFWQPWLRLSAGRAWPITGVR